VHPQVQPPPLRSRAGAWLLAGSLAAILAGTLSPGPTLGYGGISWRPQLPDLLRNLLLFAPLGAALALRGLRRGPTVLLAAALSLAVESAQLFVPGRSPALFDVIGNAGGALAGHALAGWAARWRAPSVRAAARLCAASALAAGGVLLGGAAALAPAPSAGPIFAHLPPYWGNLERFRGQLIEASLAGIPLTRGRVPDPGALRRALAGDHVLRLVLRPGTPPRRLSGIFALTDGAQHTLALVGIDGEDLVYRLRTRADALGFGPIQLRAAGALAGVAPGEPLELRFERRGRRVELVVGGGRRAQLAFGLGSGWRLLVPRLALPRAGERALDAAWIALWLLPVGWFARRTPAAALALALVFAAAAAAPALGPVLPAGASDAGAALLGFGAGVVAGRRARAPPPAPRAS
jgi:hypothetical protein